METTKIIRPVVLTTVAFATALASNVVLNKAIDLDSPKEALKEATDKTEKEQLVLALKVIGAAVAIALVSNYIGHKVAESVDGALWPNYEEPIQIEAVIE